MYAQGCKALSGEQIDHMDVSQLQTLIHSISVFYRVSPRHKHKIVKVRHLSQLRQIFLAQLFMTLLLVFCSRLTISLCFSTAGVTEQQLRGRNDGRWSK